MSTKPATSSIITFAPEPSSWAIPIMPHLIDRARVIIIATHGTEFPSCNLAYIEALIAA